MRYIGSKKRLAKYILPHLEQSLKECDVYWEPFVGGCNMMDQVKHPLRCGSDANYFLIQMWEHFCWNDWVPCTKINETLYKGLRELMRLYLDEGIEPEPEIAALIGFAGVACSFSGDFYAGYSKDGDRNKAAETLRALQKQRPNLTGVRFRCGNYQDMGEDFNHHRNGKRLLIYCDPPYAGVKYYKQAPFDSEMFWSWCAERAGLGDHVYVSEYDAPDDLNIELLWEQEILTNAHQSKQKMAKERLFRVYGE